MAVSDGGTRRLNRERWKRDVVSGVEFIRGGLGLTCGFLVSSACTVVGFDHRCKRGRFEAFRSKVTLLVAVPGYCRAASNNRGAGCGWAEFP